MTMREKFYLNYDPEEGLRDVVIGIEFRRDLRRAKAEREREREREKARESKRAEGLGFSRGQ